MGVQSLRLSIGKLLGIIFLSVVSTLLAHNSLFGDSSILRLEYFEPQASQHRTGSDNQRYLDDLFTPGTSAILFEQVMRQSGFHLVPLKQDGEKPANAIAYTSTVGFPVTFSNLVKGNFLVRWKLTIVGEFDADMRLTRTLINLDDQAL